jgi:AcrR family transcriptional regulator
MPRPRFDKLDPDRRRSLLDTAAGEFAAHGYEGASLNRVIDHAGLSKGVFYYYFDDKADLFATVLDRVWEAILPEEPTDLDALDQETFWPTVERLFHEMTANTMEYPWLPGLAKLIYHPPPATDFEDLVDAQFDRARRWLAALLSRGQELGVVRSDLPGELLLSMVMGAAEAADRWMAEHWQEIDPTTFDDTMSRLFGTLRRMVE